MDPEIRKKAEKRVRRIKRFYKNLAIWLLVSAFLFGINLLTSTAHLWAIYPFLGWGLGIAIEAVSLFGSSSRVDDWEDRKTREIARRQQHRNKQLSDEVDEKPLDLGETTKKPLYREEDLV